MCIAKASLSEAYIAGLRENTHEKTQQIRVLLRMLMQVGNRADDDGSLSRTHE
jgi:hypothetical protein